jgi:hypothetical protein
MRAAALAARQEHDERSWPEPDSDSLENDWLLVKLRQLQEAADAAADENDDFLAGSFLRRFATVLDSASWQERGEVEQEDPHPGTRWIDDAACPVVPFPGLPALV